MIDIWKYSPVLKKIREREKFKGCGECEYVNICGGCRARAYGYFNDLQAPDPSCEYNQKYWDELTKGLVKSSFWSPVLRTKIRENY